MKRHQVLWFLLLWGGTSAFKEREEKALRFSNRPALQAHVRNGGHSIHSQAALNPQSDRHMAVELPFVGEGDSVMGRRKCRSTSSAAPCMKKMSREKFLPF